MGTVQNKTRKTKQEKQNKKYNLRYIGDMCKKKKNLKTATCSFLS